MAAYLTTNASRTSSITPNAGIKTKPNDDGTIGFRRDQVAVTYDVRMVHEWITQAELDALVAFPGANGWGPHTFTLQGVNYSGTLTNEVQVLEHKGSLYMAESRLIALKV